MVTAYLYNLNNFADGWPSYKKRFQRFHNCLRFSWAWCYLDSLLLLLCAVIIELCSSISRYHSAGGRVVYLAVHCVLLKDNWSKIENLNIGRLKDCLAKDGGFKKRKEFRKYSTNFSVGKSKAPRSEFMDKLNRKRAWVLSTTALGFRDWFSLLLTTECWRLSPLYS